MAEKDRQSPQPRNAGIQEVLRDYDIISVEEDKQISAITASRQDVLTVNLGSKPGADTEHSRVQMDNESGNDPLVVKENPSAATIISTLDKDSDFVDVNVFKDSSLKTNTMEVEQERSPAIICPHVNCPEKIIICLDLDEEVDSTIFRSRSGDKYSGLELAKRAIKMFVLHKNQIDPRHEFALVVFQQEATMIQDFTRNPQEILRLLDDTVSTESLGPLNLSQLFETIGSEVTLPDVVGDPTVIPPPFVVRVLLAYGRSQSVPYGAGLRVQRELESSPYFFTDVLYIHEPPNESNKCEEIFQVLCDLDHNGLSYIFEQSKYTPILNSGAKLLAHPLQRPQQLQASYKIGTGPPVNPIPREEKVFSLQ